MAQQGRNPAIAVAPIPGRELDDVGGQDRLVVARQQKPALGGARLTDDPAGTALGNAQHRPDMINRFAPPRGAYDFPRKCLAIRVARRLGSIDVIEMLAELCLEQGVPGHVRSDQGPEFIAIAVREWIAAVGAKTAFIEKASPWENGYVESFNGKLRDELLNVEIFYSLAEARIMIEQWRRHYNTVRPHSALGYRPPAPSVVQWPAAPDSSTVARPATAPLAPSASLN